MNKYVAMMQRHQEDYNRFPIGWAFGKEQFAEMMAEWGLNVTDTDKIVSIGCGGYLKKEDVPEFKAIEARHKAEFEKAVNEDKTGKEFVCQMFYKELSSHDFGWTGELQETLDALGFTLEEVNSRTNLKRGLSLAMAKFTV